MGAARWLLRCVAAGLAGASGLVLESLLIQGSGLVLGQSTAGAFGLALFVGGWALGAWVSGASSLRTTTRLWIAGLGVVLSASTALLACASPTVQAWSAPWHALFASGCLFVPAFFQGWVLPALLSSTSTRSQSTLLLASNLAGALLGALALPRFLEHSGDRGAAAWAGMGLIALACTLGACSSRTVASVAERGSLWTRGGMVLGLATAAVLGLEWVGLRLASVYLGGMQPALDAALAASVLALTLGAWSLPWLFARSKRAVGWCLSGAGLGCVWPQLAVRIEWGAQPALIQMLILLGPGLLFIGALPAVLLSREKGERGERMGALYFHECWGALVFLPLAHLYLLPSWGTHGLLACCALLLALAAWIASEIRVGAMLAALFALGAAIAWGSPVLQAPALRQPAFQVRSFAEDREFAVSVVDDGLLGERTLLTDSFRAAGTGESYRYMQALGHLPVLLHEQPRSAAVLALGTGTTLGALRLHSELASIDVLEIAPAVVAAAPFFADHNGGPLDADPRVRLRLGDGRRTLAASPARYDVITMEPLLPDSPFGVYLYTREFYVQAQAALRPGGLLCQWIPPHALEPASFRSVLRTFQAAFAWSGVWLFGTQLVLVGGAQAPRMERASSLRSPELQARLASLGLGESGALAANLIQSHDRSSAPWTDPVRELSDVQPWIIYRARRTGPSLLLDLPRNLQSVLDGSKQPVRALWRARLAFAAQEARLRGVSDARFDSLDLERELDAARTEDPHSPELKALVREVEFVEALRVGVNLLASDAQLALPSLVKAAELQPERADVHLYLAVALQKLKSKAAPRALERALSLCPRLAETREAERARALGLTGLPVSNLR